MNEIAKKEYVRPESEITTKVEAEFNFMSGMDGKAATWESDSKNSTWESESSTAQW